MRRYRGRESKDKQRFRCLEGGNCTHSTINRSERYYATIRPFKHGGERGAECPRQPKPLAGRPE